MKVRVVSSPTVHSLWFGFFLVLRDCMQNGTCSKHASSGNYALESMTNSALKLTTFALSNERLPCLHPSAFVRFVLLNLFGLQRQKKFWQQRGHDLTLQLEHSARVGSYTATATLAVQPAHSSARSVDSKAAPCRRLPLHSTGFPSSLIGASTRVHPTAASKLRPRRETDLSFPPC